MRELVDEFWNMPAAELVGGFFRGIATGLIVGVILVVVFYFGVIRRG